MFGNDINPLSFVWSFHLNCVCESVSCCLSTCIGQNKCRAYITIQTLLLWKALSFLLCAGKHHWEHEQNTSKHDTNSCCCGWLHAWMEPPICLRFRGNKRRLNCTNYGIHYIVQSDWALCHRAASCRTPLSFKYFIVYIPLLSPSMSVSVYRHMVGAFYVSSGFAVATRVSLLHFGTKLHNKYFWVRIQQKTTIMSFFSSSRKPFRYKKT